MNLPQLPPGIKRKLPWLYIPVGYVFLFAIFAYLAFPYDRLKERIIFGYNQSQADSAEPKRMEIGDVTWAWRFPGVVLTDVDLIAPKPKTKPGEKAAEKTADKIAEKVADKPSDGADPAAAASADATKPADGAEGEAAAASAEKSLTAVHVDEVYARISPISLLLGKVVLNFSAEGFGGELSGSFENSPAATKLSVQLDDINPGELPGVPELLQLPLSGKLSGHVDLTLTEGKYSMADGTVDLQIEELKLADGKTKVRGLLALPEIDAGTLTLKATATQGRVDIEEFTVKGTDLEATAEGKLRLRDKLETSMTEQMQLSFKFSDAYRDKDDNTRSLLGKPGDALGGLIDMTPQTKQAKQPDGTYSWRVLGTFSSLNFQPSRPTKPGAGGAAPASTRSTAQTGANRVPRGH